MPKNMQQDYYHKTYDLESITFSTNFSYTDKFHNICVLGQILDYNRTDYIAF
jgi:hypothetical protein